MTSPWSSIDYVELHCHSSFSLLDGASTPEALIARAGDLGMDALALTDHDALYGAVPFVTAARARGVRPILGAELTLEDGHHLTLLVEQEQTLKVARDLAGFTAGQGEQLRRAGQQAGDCSD